MSQNKHTGKELLILPDISFNTNAGQTIAREMLIVYLNTGTAASPVWSAIENGTLHVANANIDNLNAGKITTGTLPTGRIGTSSITGAKIADYTLASTHMSDGSAVNRVIGENAVSYGKTSFQPTLDQVGTNTANIDTLYGYFTGSAHFQKSRPESHRE